MIVQCTQKKKREKWSNGTQKKGSMIKGRQRLKGLMEGLQSPAEEILGKRRSLEKSS